MSMPTATAVRGGTRAGRQTLVYFALAFAISWLGALGVAWPHLLRHEAGPKAGLLMFPVMLLGPSLAGVVLTGLFDGRSGLRELLAKVFQRRVSALWWTPLLIFPTTILFVLLFLRALVSSVYTPNLFLMGVLFGVPAGLLEEMGWTGFALNKMVSPENALKPSIVLGLLWALWHLPVVDHLGAASPHGSYWLPFFLAFALLLTAVRILIAWAYLNTGSLLLAQALHASSTGSLVVFGASRVTPGQEALWYAVYGAALWAVVAVVVKRYGRRLVDQRRVASVRAS